MTHSPESAAFSTGGRFVPGVWPPGGSSPPLWYVGGNVAQYLADLVAWLAAVKIIINKLRNVSIYKNTYDKINVTSPKGAFACSGSMSFVFGRADGVKLFTI